MSSNRSDLNLQYKRLTELFTETLNFQQRTKKLCVSVRSHADFDSIIQRITHEPEFYDPYCDEMPVLPLLRAISAARNTIMRASNEQQCLAAWQRLSRAYHDDTYFMNYTKVDACLEELFRLPQQRETISGPVEDKMHTMLHQIEQLLPGLQIQPRTVESRDTNIKREDAKMFRPSPQDQARAAGLSNCLFSMRKPDEFNVDAFINQLFQLVPPTPHWDAIKGYTRELASYVKGAAFRAGLTNSVTISNLLCTLLLSDYQTGKLTSRDFLENAADEDKAKEFFKNIKSVLDRLQAMNADALLKPFFEESNPAVQKQMWDFVRAAAFTPAVNEYLPDLVTIVRLLRDTKTINMLLGSMKEDFDRYCTAHAGELQNVARYYRYSKFITTYYAPLALGLPQESKLMTLMSPAFMTHFAEGKYHTDKANNMTTWQDAWAHGMIWYCIAEMYRRSQGKLLQHAPRDIYLKFFDFNQQKDLQPPTTIWENHFRMMMGEPLAQERNSVAPSMGRR